MGGERGFALFWCLVLSLIVTLIGYSIFLLLMEDIKTEKAQRETLRRFQGADGGVYAVAGWIMKYKDANVPEEVTVTNTYTAYVNLLGGTVRIPAGFSTAWQGFDVRINSKDKTETKEVEAIVFVPVSPAGYGNE